MARNIEIKARIENIEEIELKARALADRRPIVIAQDDTFFACEQGRLKLRVFAADAGELIFYRRANQSGPKESFYIISPTTSPNSLREALALAYGVTGRIRKTRTLYLVGRTRIHLDRVADLGDFVELEIVLREDESAQIGVAEAEELMSALGIDSTRLVEGAYVDLLPRRHA